MAFLSLSRLEKLQGAQKASALRTTSWAFKALSKNEIRRGSIFLLNSKGHHLESRSTSMIAAQGTNVTYLGIQITKKFVE